MHSIQGYEDATPTGLFLLLLEEDMKLQTLDVRPSTIDFQPSLFITHYSLIKGVLIGSKNCQQKQLLINGIVIAVATVFVFQSKFVRDRRNADISAIP